MLFEYFDRLLLLAKGGKVTYFGDIGKNSRVLLDYFEHNGARVCGKEENPAEYLCHLSSYLLSAPPPLFIVFDLIRYLLEAIGAGVGGKTDKDWVQIWKSSPEADSIGQEIQDRKKAAEGLHEDDIPREFATTTYATHTSSVSFYIF